MEIVCGARVRAFDGRRYFYFWHLRTGQRTVGEEGGLRLPSGLREAWIDVLVTSSHTST